MKPEPGTRVLIQSLYPGYEKLVDRGLDEQPAFLELCEDYRRCLVALEKVRQPGSGRHPERVREYEELLTELGHELEGWIEDLMQVQGQYRT